MIEIFNKITEHNNADIILGGDLNLVLDMKLGSLNRKTNHHKSLAALNMFMDQFILVNAWRLYNEDKFEFTWFKRKPNESFARIDYLLVTYVLVADIINAKHLPAYRSDHSAAKMVLHCGTQSPCGPGFWKLNDSILYRKENLDMLNETQKVLDRSVNYEEYVR